MKTKLKTTPRSERNLCHCTTPVQRKKKSCGALNLSKRERTTLLHVPVSLMVVIHQQKNELTVSEQEPLWRVAAASASCCRKPNSLDVLLLSCCSLTGHCFILWSLCACIWLLGRAVIDTVIAAGTAAKASCFHWRSCGRHRGHQGKSPLFRL